MWKFIFVILTLLYSLQSVCCYSQQDEIKRSVDFTFDFYRTLFDESKNTITSPFSLRVLLGALYQSASGIAEQELANIVKFGEKVDNLKAASENINHLTHGPSVKIANKIYLKNDGVLSANFQNVLTQLKSAIEQVNFANGAAVANQMNTWVEEQTNGLIKNLVSSDSVKPEHVLFLINTIYFKAQWLYPFDNRSVRKSPFTSYNGESQQIDLMSQFKFFNTAYSSDLKSKVLELPYANGTNYVYWIIMPDSGESLKNVADKLDHNVLQYIKSNFNGAQTIVGIPKYETELDIDCVGILQKLGLQSIFTAPSLNLLNGKSNLKVDQIKQKSKIIVNTDGTEAASGSYLSIVPYTTWPTFYVNRPFIYLILTADTTEPIFVGHYSNAA